MKRGMLKFKKNYKTFSYISQPPQFQRLTTIQLASTSFFIIQILFEIMAYVKDDRGPSTKALYQQGKICPYIYKHKSSKQNTIDQSQFQNAQNYRSVKKSIGVIKASWTNEKNQLLTFVYGTAFHVTSRIIMTCTHNIYSSFRNRFADKIEFFPDLDGDVQGVHDKLKRQSIEIPRQNKQKYSETYFQNFFTNVHLSYYEAQSKLDFQYQPKRQEISLIGLKQKKPQNEDIQIGIPIGKLLPEDIDLKTKLMIIGYPSEKYRSTVEFKTVSVNRRQVYGQYHSIQCYKNQKGDERMQILNYTVKTSFGMSGSPVLAYRDKQIYAIGIHTHRGKSTQYNSGVYFSSDFLQVIKQFQARLRKKIYKNGEKDEQSKIENIVYKENDSKQYKDQGSDQINLISSQNERQRNKSDSLINSPIQSFAEIDSEQQNSHISLGEAYQQEQSVFLRYDLNQNQEQIGQIIKDNVKQKQQQELLSSIIQQNKQYLSQSEIPQEQMSEMSDLGLLEYLTFVKDLDQSSNQQSREFTNVKRNCYRALIVENHHIFLKNQYFRYAKMKKVSKREQTKEGVNQSQKDKGELVEY